MVATKQVAFYSPPYQTANTRMGDAADFTIAALIQILRAGISYLKDVSPIVLYAVAFSLAIVEGSILSNTLPTRHGGQRRLTLYPSVMLVLRILFDFISSDGSMNAALGMAGTLAGLLMGPVFHSSPPSDSDDDDDNKRKKSAHSASIDELSSVLGTTRMASPTPRRVVTPSKPVMHHVVDVDNETSRQVLFTPAMSAHTLEDAGALSSDARSYTRVDDSSFSTDDTVRYAPARNAYGRSRYPPAPESETVYMDAVDTDAGLTKPAGVKDAVRKLRAQAKEDDLNRRNLLHERDQVLADGDVARAFLLKHQAENLKKSMIESDQEAARTIFEYYNPPARREKHRIDLRGLHAQEALKYCDDALKELQESGSSNVLSVMIGRGKNTDGVGKGKVKPTLRQFAKAQGISVRESDDGTMLVLSLPTLRSPMSYD